MPEIEAEPNRNYTIYRHFIWNSKPSDVKLQLEFREVKKRGKMRRAVYITFWKNSQLYWYGKVTRHNLDEKIALFSEMTSQEVPSAILEAIYKYVMGR